MAGISHYVPACVTDNRGEIIRKGINLSRHHDKTQKKKETRQKRLSETQSPQIHPASSEPIRRLFQHAAARRRDHRRRRRCAVQRLNTCRTIHRAALIFLLVGFSLQLFILLDRLESVRRVIVAETVQVYCFTVYRVTAAAVSRRGRSARVTCFDDVGFFALAPDVAS